MLFLTRRDVESLLDLDRLVEALAPAMADLSAGRVSMPARIMAMVDDAPGLLSTMPVYVPASRTLATKLVSVYPHNPARGLTSHQALIALFEPDTGSALVLMDGAYITAARTAAGSALATRLLAQPEASVLVIVGTGVQARAHARAIPGVRPIRAIRVVGRDEAKAAALAGEITEQLAIPATVAASFAAAARGADVICATTHSPRPVVQGAYLEPGTHVNSVGLPPQGRELDDETIRRAHIIVESRRAALARDPGGAYDLVGPIDAGLIDESHLRAEIGEIVAGLKPGRTDPAQITLYKSVGVAVQDAVAAQLVWDAARDRGLGREVAL